MDYINTNFVTRTDLENVNEKILFLNKEKNAAVAELSSRVRPNASVLVISDKVSQLIEELSSIPASPSVDYITRLTSKYGQLKSLLKLKSLVEKKAALKISSALLERAADLESRLDNINESSQTPEVLSALIDCSSLLMEADLSTSVRSALEQVLQSLTQSRQKTSMETLTTALNDIKWLSSRETFSIDSKNLNFISSSFADLINLQAATSSPAYPASWWAIDSLVKPFEVRFNFHFRQDTKANRVSKPEWAFSYVEDFLADNLPTLELVMGDSLARHKRIAVFEIITAVLHPVRKKLTEMIDVINSNIASSEDGEKGAEKTGRLLSHLIFEATSFDQRLRNDYKYNPYIKDYTVVPEKKWMGLTGDVLIRPNKSDAVNNWLNLELQLARKRFDKEIIGTPDAFILDSNFSAGSKESDQIQPTYSAYGLAILFENLTGHFRTLSIVKYQLKYVSRILLLFLDEYLNALNAQFRLFCESNSQNIIQTFLLGASKKEHIISVQVATGNGLKALETLTGLYCLAKFILAKMQDWESELIYIQLWDYYKSISPNSEVGKSIFESTINEYRSLMQKIAERYDDFVRRQIRAVLKEYVIKYTWSVDFKDEEVSPHLSGFVTMLETHLSFLKQSLPSVDYYLLAEKACNSLALTLLEYVVHSNKFSKSGVEKLKADFLFVENKLLDVLLLNSLTSLTIKDNNLLGKVRQSIELMGQFDAGAAKLMKSLYADASGIRSQFDNGLADLTDEDIRDLLYRIL